MRLSALVLVAAILVGQEPPGSTPPPPPPRPPIGKAKKSGVERQRESMKRQVGNSEEPGWFLRPFAGRTVQEIR